MSLRPLRASPVLAAFSRGAALAALVLCGCGGGGAAHDGPTVWDAESFRDGHSDGEGGEDGGTAEDGSLPGDDGPLVGPTSGSLAVAFEVDATGTGTIRLGQIAVGANAVATTLGGVAHVGIAYQHHVWAGYTLYDVVSVAADGSNLAVTYLYCQGTALPYAYTESFVHKMDWETASGTCAGTESAWDVEVSLPALAVAPAAMDSGMTIAGTGIRLDASGGQLDLAGATWDVVPFNTVDCSTVCPGGSWYELHVMLLRPAAACFTILYLHLDDPGTVQLSYTLCLPTLDTTDAVYSATWSGTLLERQSAVPPWRPPAPPLWAMREVHGEVALVPAGR